MKIAPLDIQPVATPAATERKAPPEPVSGVEPSAKVQLTAEGALAGTEAARADFDSEKVERVAQAIRDGNFQVNAEAIADQLIANAQELLPKSSH